MVKQKKCMVMYEIPEWEQGKNTKPHENKIC